MLTQAPLPTWSNLCRALVKRPPSDADMVAPWVREGEIAGWLSRSAWSLALIALWRKRRAPELTLTVWIPDYFCNASLVALRKLDVKLVFYPLTDNMTPEIAACRRLSELTPPDIFVLVHYFGQPAHAAVARDFCANHGAWLIEDAAHVLRPVGSVGMYGDFVLYSPHKHLPIPDGAVLVVRTDGPGLLRREALEDFGPPKNWSCQLHALQQELGRTVNSGRFRAVVWLTKRVLQKFSGYPGRRSTQPFAELSNSISLQVATEIFAPSQISLSKRLIAGLLADLGAVARERQRRQLLWDALLLDSDEALYLGSVSASKRSVSRDWTPYLIAYRVCHETAESVYYRWQSLGLPVTTWPDLPPEVIDCSERHTNALHLRFCRLYLPVHQSLSMHRVIALGRLQAKVEEDDSSLLLRWDGATQGQWQKWMEQSGRSNLLQSWAYGEAKAQHSGWQVRRGVFYSNNEPIAIVQILQKRVAGFLNVTRINRGPMFLRDLLPQELVVVWKKLGRLGNIWQGRILSVAPELVLSGASLALIYGMEFRRNSSQTLESVWVDLRLDQETLRKKLDSKWRNMLIASEMHNFRLDIDCNAQSFDWMMERYQELMQEKNFSGPPIDFILALRKNLSDSDQLITLRAIHEGEIVAGICLARHGVAATYLLGWNGVKGRKLKANQYLLWNAVVHLKQLGLLWFDLGGINEESTPGITKFKMGLNGERYELVGEYWKY